MKVKVTLNIWDDARRGINVRRGKPGRASHAQVLAEIATVWTTYCQDMEDELRMHEEQVVADHVRALMEECETTETVGHHCPSCGKRTVHVVVVDTGLQCARCGRISKEAARDA